MQMLVAATLSTALALAAYWAVTPRGWRLRTQLSNRARMIDFGLVVGAIVLWGVLLNALLPVFVNVVQVPGAVPPP